MNKALFVVLILLCGTLFFQAIGFDYTGAVSADPSADPYGFNQIGEVMSSVIKLPFEGVVKPVFETLFGKEYYTYSIKLMLIILLAMTLSLGTRLVFKENKRTANIVAIIFSVFAVVVTPTEFINSLFGKSAGSGGFFGSLLGSVFILVVVVSILWPFLFAWKARTKGSKALKALTALVLILFNIWMGEVLILPIGNLSFLTLAVGLVNVILASVFIYELVSIFFVPGAPRDIAVAAGKGTGTGAKKFWSWAKNSTGTNKPKPTSVNVSEIKDCLDNIKKNNLGAALTLNKFKLDKGPTVNLKPVELYNKTIIAECGNIIFEIKHSSDPFHQVIDALCIQVSKKAKRVISSMKPNMAPKEIDPLRVKQRDVTVAVSKLESQVALLSYS